MGDSLADDDVPAKRIKLEAPRRRQHHPQLQPPLQPLLQHPHGADAQQFQLPWHLSQALPRPLPLPLPLPPRERLDLARRGRVEEEETEEKEAHRRQHRRQPQQQGASQPPPLQEPRPPPLPDHQHLDHEHGDPLHQHLQQQQQARQQQQLRNPLLEAGSAVVSADIAVMAPAAMPPPPASLQWPGGSSASAVLFEAPCQWPPSSSPPMHPPSPMAAALRPPANLDVDAVGLLAAPAASYPPLLAPDAPPPMSMASAIPAVEFNLSPASHASFSRPHSHLQKRPRCPPPTLGDPVPNGCPPPCQPRDHQHVRRIITNRGLLISPFRDCVGSFGEAHKCRFDRPFDGKVNGYIKFNWPKDRQSRRPSAARASPLSDAPSAAESAADAKSPPPSSSSLVPLGPTPAPAASTTALNVSPDVHGIFDFSSFVCNPNTSTGFELMNPAGVNPTVVSADMATEMVPIGAPRMVPKLFGYEAKMDQTDRKFWTFYIKNWCPGRSVLLETNLWLKDFAQMHKSDGVRAAIQSLAGIYIYDYQPVDSIRRWVNERFCEAEARFSMLLNDPATTQSEIMSNELITMAVILSMQDIVLTERRLRKPHEPRWLSGFKHGEIFLHETDQGSRFWKRSNAQLSSLRISQSIIVGRAMILAQPMMRLPGPDVFDPEPETSRFAWLLYGTERDMYQIHGGCGFSKKLLHIMSQITYCAARLQQDPENMVVPVTTQYLYDELVQMRQWSGESKDWETAKAGPPVIEWVRSVPDGFIIGSSADMTDVTAEAWRLTAIIYLQCRVLRLSRNHPAVVANLSDLARCICIMPTSGYQFTAQAPLFPVFLLGMLATDPDHKRVSKTWFDEVVSTPVRSSVPPLYEALQRIWQWIDAEIVPPLSPTNVDQAIPIGLRYPWWEYLVQQVDVREVEVLCLT